jgi:hypothetical protein
MYERQHTGPTTIDKHGDGLDILSLPLRDAGYACPSVGGVLFCLGG